MTTIAITLNLFFPEGDEKVIRKLIKEFSKLFSDLLNPKLPLSFFEGEKNPANIIHLEIKKIFDKAKSLAKAGNALKAANFPDIEFGSSKFFWGIVLIIVGLMFIIITVVIFFLKKRK
jgi:hypothetical protein